VQLITMLFRTNLFAMVTISYDLGGASTGGGANKVQIWNDQTGKFAGELRSRNEVRGVALRKDIIAMVCEYAIYVYTLGKLRVIQHLTTAANSRGLCVLASASEPWILSCPGQSLGTIRVQVGQDDRSSHVFQAHETALAALAMNASGSLIASASERGTVLKVFQRSDGQLLYRLRRSARPAEISCLVFRDDDRFLAVASSSTTVHIFKLDPSTAEENDRPSSTSTPFRSPPPTPASPGGPEGCEQKGASPGDNNNSPERIGDAIASQITRAVTQIVSQSAADTVNDVVKGVMPLYFNDLRSFAHFQLPDMDSGGQPAVDARGKQARIVGPQLAFHKTEPQLSVLHYSGLLYEYRFDPNFDPKRGTQECSFRSATTWFATRPDFKLRGPGTQVPTVAGGVAEDDENAEEWQLL